MGAHVFSFWPIPRHMASRCSLCGSHSYQKLSPNMHVRWHTHNATNVRIMPSRIRKFFDARVWVCVRVSGCFRYTTKKNGKQQQKARQSAINSTRYPTRHLTNPHTHTRASSRQRMCAWLKRRRRVSRTHGPITIISSKFSGNLCLIWPDLWATIYAFDQNE